MANIQAEILSQIEVKPTKTIEDVLDLIKPHSNLIPLRASNLRLIFGVHSHAFSGGGWARAGRFDGEWQLGAGLSKLFGGGFSVRARWKSNE